MLLPGSTLSTPAPRPRTGELTTPQAPHPNDPALSSTPFWAILATFTIAPLAGIAATIQTATLACQHHTVDACIPAFEALFGILVTGSVVIWLASSNRRGRSISSGLKLATAATLIWVLAMTVLGPLICPDSNANDVVCPLALPLGIAAFAAAAASAWHLQERSEPTNTRPGAGGR